MYVSVNDKKIINYREREYYYALSISGRTRFVILL